MTAAVCRQEASIRLITIPAASQHMGYFRYLDATPRRPLRVYARHDTHAGPAGALAYLWTELAGNGWEFEWHFPPDDAMYADAEVRPDNARATIELNDTHLSSGKMHFGPSELEIDDMFQANRDALASVDLFFVSQRPVLSKPSLLTTDPYSSC